MFVVKIRVPACLDPGLNGVPHCFGAVVQHLRDAITVMLLDPLFFGHVSSELRGVL